MATRYKISFVDRAETFTAKKILNTPVTLKGYTVAGLGGLTPVQGDTAFCTDLLLPAFFAVAVGGGAVVGPVFYDGTNWISV